jgi:predicted acyltransferase
MRFPGVLQRIGVCYGVAATIALLAGWRTVLASLLVFCAAYSVLMLRAPDRQENRDLLTKEDNFARRVDERVFNRTATLADGTRLPLATHTYAAYPDPEGIVSTLPAIGSALLGVLVGYSLRRRDRTHAERCARLLANGVVVSILGVLLSWWLMPVNKSIWTPSFTFLTAGLGMLTLGAVFYFTDVRGRRAWAWPFNVYGTNAIAAFMFAGILVRVGTIVQVDNPGTGLLVSLWKFCQFRAAEGVHRAGAWWARVLPVLPPLDTPGNVALAFPLGLVLVVFLILWVMHALRIYLKV